MPDPITLGAIGVSTVLKVFGFGKKRKARKLQAEADRTRLSAINIQRAAERRNIVRQALAERGGILAQDANSGVDLSSSTTQGTTGSVGSQLQFNTALLDTLTGLDNRAAQLDIRAGRKLSQASTFGSLAGLLDTGISQGVFQKSTFGIGT